MNQDWDSAMADPYILEIASRFLEGFEREMASQQKLIDALDNDVVRQTITHGDPILGQMYEGKTKEQLQERAPICAIAVGVAFALRNMSSG